MRIVSWNMQGGSGSDADKVSMINQMFSNSYDVICLQEATRRLSVFDQPTTSLLFPMGSWMQADAVHGTRGPSSHDYVCVDYSFGINPRCSLVTYVKKHVFHSYATLPYSPYTPGVRDMLIVRVSIGGTLYKIGSVHLTSNAASALGQFDYFRSDMIASGERYAIVGDFNVEPLTLEAHSPTIIGHFHHPNIYTHRSANGVVSILDYCYYEVPVIVGRENEIIHSDHRVLYYTLG